jgi:hypothetical protein
MPSYQLRDTATRQILARDLADYAAAEAALDRLDDELEHDLAANSEGAGRIRLRLDVEKVTDGTAQAVGHHALPLGVDDYTDRCPRRSRRSLPMTRDTPPEKPVPRSHTLRRATARLRRGSSARRQDDRRAPRTAGSAVEELLGRYHAQPLSYAQTQKAGQRLESRSASLTSSRTRPGGSLTGPQPAGGPEPLPGHDYRGPPAVWSQPTGSRTGPTPTYGPAPLTHVRITTRRVSRLCANQHPGGFPFLKCG